MVTISLDEYGNFEKTYNTRPLFVAGVIFDDMNQANETETERKRLEAYFRSIMDDLGMSYRYPRDLHLVGNRNNAANVREVKNMFINTVAEFFQKGTYKGKPLHDPEDERRNMEDRKGAYHIFVMLKSDIGKKKLLDTRAGKMVNDDYAANRYVHMAGGVVNRIIVHNPLWSVGEQKINVDVASRVSENIASMNGAKKHEYKDQGYREYEVGNDGNNVFRIMNADIYRTLIGQEILVSGKEKIMINDFKVSSINYEGNARNQEFLYLCDSLCSYLAENLTGNSADEWLLQIDEKCNLANASHENLIFGYDAIDNQFSTAWNYYEKFEMFDALSEMYEITKCKGVFADYYKQKWLPLLYEKIVKNMSPKKYSEAASQVVDMLTTSNLDQNKLIYLVNQLEQMLPKMDAKYKNQGNWKRAQFAIYEAGLSAFCHIGDYPKAISYYEKCKEYVEYIDLDDSITLTNRYLVCLEDSFDFGKCIELSEENVKTNVQAILLKNKVLGIKEDHASRQMGVAYSQHARILAVNRKREAEQFFHLALEQFEKFSADYKITQSYLLHYLIDAGEKAKFEQEATEYFEGAINYKDRFEKIRKMALSTGSMYSVKFVLFVYLKALFLYGRDELTDVLWENIYTWLDKTWLDEKRKVSEALLTGHPAELSCKYLEMMAYVKKDSNREALYRSKRENCLEQNVGVTIEALTMFGEIQIAELKGETDKKREMIRKLYDFMKEKYTVCDGIEHSSVEQLYDHFKTIFTFMYY